MAQNITIQGLDGVASSNLDLATPFPVQRANINKFESVTLNQVKNTIYAVCDTASDVALKVAYLSNFPSCVVSQGTTISVIFTYENTADNISLKLQDSSKNDLTGNISIMAMNSAQLQLGAGSIPANGRLTLEYDGTYWEAHTDIVKRSDSSVTHADGTISYTPISELDSSSPAPINSSAIGNDLLRTSDVVKTITASDNPISAGAVKTETERIEGEIQVYTAGSNISIDENNEISCDVSTMNFMGAKDTYSELPSSGDIGDVWNVIADSTNYCWNGTNWVVIGSSVDISGVETDVKNIKKVIPSDATENNQLTTDSKITTALTDYYNEQSATETKTISLGKTLSKGSTIRVLFANGHNGGSLTINGYAVKVNKCGTLIDIPTHTIDSVTVCIQPYTTLDMMFDGSQFIVIGNPDVITKSGTQLSITIKADGYMRISQTVTSTSVGGTTTVTFPISFSEIPNISLDVARNDTNASQGVQNVCALNPAGFNAVVIISTTYTTATPISYTAQGY